MIPVIVNAAGGAAAARGDRLRGELEQAFAAAGLAIDLKLVDGDGVTAAVEAAREHKLVVAGGGDGTLAAAAAVLVGSDTALGVLPLGTLNHFARALGIAPDLAGAARQIAAGTVRQVDVARVDDRLFINNASVGVYPEMVADRDRRRAPKWLAALPASWQALRRLRHHRMRLIAPDRTQEVVTPLLFVGNNRYELASGEVGQRTSLSDGVLSVYAVASRSRTALIGFALRTLAGRADPARDFAAFGDTPELTVSGSTRPIRIALDGEVTHLSMPLRFSIEPQALAVVAPLEGEGATA